MRLKRTSAATAIITTAMTSFASDLFNGLAVRVLAAIVRSAYPTARQDYTFDSFQNSSMPREGVSCLLSCDNLSYLSWKDTVFTGRPSYRLTCSLEESVARCSAI